MDDSLPSNLSGEYFGQFQDALVSAFRTKETLGAMIRRKLDKQFHLVASASNDDMSTIAYNLINTAESEGWLHELIIAVYKERPKNKEVASFYQKYQQLTQKVSPSEEKQSLSSSPPQASLSLDTSLPKRKKPGRKKSQDHVLALIQEPQQQSVAFEISQDRNSYSTEGRWTPLVTPIAQNSTSALSLSFRRRRHYRESSCRYQLFQCQPPSQQRQALHLYAFLSNNTEHASTKRSGRTLYT